MSYLVGPRLHFAGTFTADVSTVNNIPSHFDDPDNPPEPGWNPAGSGSWTIDSCKVTRAVLKDGSIARTATDDPIVGASLVQKGRARLVDLDPEQQMVSQIWGLKLGITSAGGVSAMTGGFRLTAFSDIWFRRLPAGGGDFAATAFYQSVIEDVVWADLFKSNFLDQLKQASDPRLLSIKFNVDGFDQTKHVGRIVGSIGPAAVTDPAHFIVGRQCMGQDSGPVYYFPAVVDAARGKLIADFGNALQTPTVRGPFNSALNLSIGTLSGNQFTSLGKIPIGAAGWYEQTAAVCEFPPDRALSDAELTRLNATPLAVVQQSGASSSLVATEGSDGLHIRAEDFVYRMSAGETRTVTLRVSRFGQPVPNAQIALAFDASQLQGGDPDVNAPQSGLQFNNSATADGNGIATVTLTAGSIAEPRKFADGKYIDGQVYGVRYTLPQSDPNAGGYFDPADFVSVLVWTDYQAPADPDWSTHVEPILSQYHQLYAVMMKFVDLSNYDSVVAHKDAMHKVFSLPDSDPHYMPVTRDLSPAKRNMILNWLTTTGNGGKPNLGPAVAVAAPAPKALAQAAAQPHEDAVAKLGGKTAALRKRLAARPAGFVKREVDV